MTSWDKFLLTENKKLTQEEKSKHTACSFVQKCIVHASTLIIQTFHVFCRVSMLMKCKICQALIS